MTKRFQPLASSSLLMRNATLSLLTEVWILVILVVAMPRLVSLLGETRFGLFSLAWIMIGYLAFLDIGVNRAATKFVSEQLAENGPTSTHRIVRTALIANSALGILGCLVLAAVSPYLIGSIFKISPELERQARLTFYAISVAIPVLLVQGALRGVLSSFQRFGWINAVNALATTAQWGLACALGWSGYGVAVIVWITVIVRLVATMTYGAVLFRLLPGLFRSLLSTDVPSGMRKLIGFGSWVTVSQIVSPVLVYLDRVLIAAFGSLGAVTLYTVPYEMMTRLRIIPASLAATLYPAFSERGANEHRGQLERLYERSVRYLLLLVVPGAIFLFVLGPELMTLWMGASFGAQASAVVRILALGTLANAVAYVPYTLLQALGRPDLTGRFHLLEFPLHLVLCFVFIPRSGINGAALASSIRFSLDAGLLFWAAGRYCKFPARSLWINAFRRIMVLACVQGLALAAVKFVFQSPWARIGSGILSVGFSLVAAWLLIVAKDEKPRISRAIKTLLRQPAS